MPKLAPETLQEFIRDVFIACRTPRAEADLVAAHLVQSSLMGIDSHGIIRVPQYVDLVRRGVIRPGSPTALRKDHGAAVVLDCNHNFGQVGSTRAVELAVEKAERFGLGCVVTVHNNHTGRVGAYTQMAAQRGMIALAACNSGPFGHWVAPFGGRAGRLATNPISFAAPTGGDPILIDMSTSMASEGKIRVCRNEGRPLPAGWIVDHQGMPSTDPQDFYGPPPGAILPLGGSVGYKGFFLGMLVEILSGALAGVSPRDESQEHYGLFFLTIQVDSFVNPATFRGLLDELIAYLESSPPLPGSRGVSVPGQREFETARLRRKHGIDVHPDIWRRIVSAAQEFNVKPPTDIAASDEAT